MASYNELNALIDAYINRNGVQAITGQILNGVLKAMVEQLGRGYTIMGVADLTTVPGTPDAPESWFASTPGTYTNFGGLVVADSEFAIFSYTPQTETWEKTTLTEGIKQIVCATHENGGHIPNVEASYEDGVLTLDFYNLQGFPGENATIDQVTAELVEDGGQPDASVTTYGIGSTTSFAFTFKNLKGDKGETGVTSVVATVDNTTGTPACTVSLVGQQLTLAFTGLKGAQGNSGYAGAAGELEVVNNLTDGGAAKALSAEMGKTLEGEVSQLEAEVTEMKIPVKYTDGYIKTSDPIGTVVNINYHVSLAPWMCYVTTCKEGDTVIVNGSGGQSPRLWAFLDGDYKIISQSASNATGDNLHISAPQNAAWIIVNDNSGKLSYLVVDANLTDIERRLEEQESYTGEKIPVLENKAKALDGVSDVLVQHKELDIFVKSGFVWDANASTEVGAIIGTKSETSYKCSNAIPVNEGDRFNIGVRKHRDYYHIIFVDENFGFVAGEIISGSESALVYHEVTAPQGAAYLLTNSYSTQQEGEFLNDLGTIKGVISHEENGDIPAAGDIKSILAVQTQIQYTYENSKYWDATFNPIPGTLVTVSDDTSFIKVDAISVIPGQEFRIGVRRYKNKFYIIFVDADYGFISGYAYSSGQLDSALTYYDVRTPQGASYLLVTSYSILPSIVWTNNYEDLKSSLATTIVSLNKDMEVAVNAASNFRYKPNNRNKMMSLLVTTDVHGDSTRFARAMEYLDAMQSIDMGICLGDIVSGSFADSSDWYKNAVNAGVKPYLTVIGNHDAGNSASVSLAGTMQQIFDKYILPVRDKIGLPTLDKSYYSIQNDTYKVTVIVLDVYDLPDTMADESNFAVSRTVWGMSQTQVDWLLSTLSAVPSDYTVLLAYHEVGDLNTKVVCDWSQKLRFNYINPAGTYVGMLGDIINAWKNGTPINKSFTPSQLQDYLPTLSVVADFSSRGVGLFAAHLTGHIHKDYIGRLTAYSDQLIIGLTTTANDNNQNGSDLDRAIGTKAEDAITVLGINTINKTVNLVRIGANVTNDMVNRSFIALPY